MPDKLIIQAGGREFDLTNLRLTLGDWERLKELGLMDDTGQLTMIGPSAITDFMLGLLQRHDKSITREVAEDVAIEDVNKVVEKIGSTGGSQDLGPLPSKRRSTSTRSRKHTGGRKKK